MYNHGMKAVVYLSEVKYLVILLFAIVAAVGIWVLIKSPMWGLNEANTYVSVQDGGSMNTSQFNALVQSYQTTYRWVGGILLLGGAFFVGMSLRLVQTSNDRTM